MNSGDKLFFLPNSAEMKISCIDDKGRNANVSIKVKYL